MRGGVSRALDPEPTAKPSAHRAGCVKQMVDPYLILAVAPWVRMVRVARGTDFSFGCSILTAPQKAPNDVPSSSYHAASAL